MIDVRDGAGPPSADLDLFSLTPMGELTCPEPGFSAPC